VDDFFEILGSSCRLYRKYCFILTKMDQRS